jgi:hypothetical protein
LPLAELRAASAAHAEADREYGLEVVMLHVAINLPSALLSNYPEFPNSCLSVRFRLSENIHQMLVNRMHIFLKKFSHQRLRQPNGFALQSVLNARATILCLVESDFGLGCGLFSHPIHALSSSLPAAVVSYCANLFAFSIH